MEVDRDKIILKPIRQHRSGWREAFQQMAAKSDDHLLDGDITISHSSWDNDEWIWESE